MIDLNRLVDPECCDGSDEYDGKIECGNICDHVGSLWRSKQEQEEKTLQKVSFTSILLSSNEASSPSVN
jgi:hypothetical protein